MIWWPYFERRNFERRRDGFVSIVLLVLLLLVVCADITARNRILNKHDAPTVETGALREEKNNIPEYPIGKFVSYAKLPDGFNYITVDGHQYLMFDGMHRFGLTHSPKCPCNDRHNKGNEKDE